MPRRFAEPLTVLSAVVCIFSLLLVGRSFFRVDTMTVPVGTRAVLHGATVEGRLWLGPAGASFGWSYASLELSRQLRSDVRDQWDKLRGVPWLGIGWGTYFGRRYLILPLWLLPLLTAIAPLRWWWRRRKVGGRGFPVATAEGGGAEGAG